jgi:hypothetical protein
VWAEVFPGSSPYVPASRCVGCEGVAVVVCYDICGWTLSFLWVLAACVGFARSMTQFGLRVGV